jgi:Tfp pilus assembly protein PilZ
MTVNLSGEPTIFQEGTAKMAIPNSEDRDEVRLDHFSPLQVKNLSSGDIYEARMQNYSNGGIYFESDGLFEEAAKIHICMQNSPYAQSSGVLEYCTGRVMWRKNLVRSYFKYGYGIRLVSFSGNEALKSSDPEGKELRKHSRTPYFQSVRFSTANGIHEGQTKNISASGIFIATNEKLEVGQKIKLNLPLKEGKTAEIIGQIVWLNDEGFGLKFKKIK